MECVFEYLFDLIISDVMMFYKDGYEICEILKMDQWISYIFIILLMVKVVLEEKMKGLEVGVDDYLFKLFDIQELEVRVKNLILFWFVLYKKLVEINKLEVF